MSGGECSDNSSGGIAKRVNGNTRMDIIRQRTVYPTTKQKRKLIALVAQHPQLILCRVSQDFTRRDSQILWNNIAMECNSLPGARKTWRQWKKTWQDIRANVKRKQQVKNGEIPSSINKLTMAEKEALGLKNVTSTTSYQDPVEFVAPEEESSHNDNINESLLNNFNDTVSYSEPNSPPEVKVKVLAYSQLKAKKIKRNENRDHSDNCVFNCDRLAIQEQRKITIKEDYFNFKKDYLRQKLIMMREQTEALKGIARELAK